jgi:hypothetical protein
MRRRPRRGSAAARKRNKTGATSPGRFHFIVFDVDKYGGMWVATRRGQIIASAGDFATIRRVVREMGVEEDAILTRVPASGVMAP